MRAAIFRKSPARKTRGAERVATKKVVLAGNPNAGKTTLFNALTKSNLRTGNFHGVTTSPSRKTVGGISYSDVPGMYAFKPYSMEEQSAIDEVKSADLVINVVDALTLENSLNLTRQIIASGVKTLVYITKSASLKRRGGKIDTEKLSAHLGVPVFDCPPKKLKKAVEGGTDLKATKSAIPLSEAYSGGNLNVAQIDKLFYNRFFSLAFFVAAILLMFFLAFHPIMPGVLLRDAVEDLICVKLSDAITCNMQSPAVISLVSEGILGGAGGVLSFIPQLIILYLFLTLLDESGITSALAFATDGLFEKVRLSGRAAFSLTSGFGCTSAAILTTRGYSTKSAQKRTVAILPFVPCGAKLPVFLTFLSPLFKNPFPAITAFYFAGVAVALLCSLLMKGGKEDLLSEVTPISLPQLKAVAIKLYFYVKGFIMKVAGVVMLFCVLSWLLSHFSFSFRYVETAEESMLCSISKVVLPVFYPMGVTDWRIAYAVLGGFAAKENIAATIALLLPLGTGLSLSATLAVCTFILLSPACISAFSASCKEVGVKFSLKCIAFQFLLAFLGAYIIRLIFIWI
ncbi:MAG: ferrous iron transporter B [Clostridia bacterium]|nr:ferrous iron transporter B [Clostridia bacterium]